MFCRLRKTFYLCNRFAAATEMNAVAVLQNRLKKHTFNNK